MDDDTEKVATIERGEAPFHEPGLVDLVRQGIDSGHLRVGSDIREAVEFGEVIFLCVGTPSAPGGKADLSQIQRVAGAIGEHLGGYRTIVQKSTVPVETGVWVESLIAERAAREADFDVASNPEFLREGRAVRDTLEPDRIVVGSDSERAIERLREVYRPIVERNGCPFIVTDMATAELIKHSSNAFLAMKISFINLVADICERTGANVESVAEAMGFDSRIGPEFLKAGLGFGGSCFPKDLRAYRHKAAHLGVDAWLLRAVEEINVSRIDAFVEKIRQAVGGIEGRRLAVWGLSFKPDTDDLRESPAIEVARRLIAEGATLFVYDPAAGPAAEPVLPDARYCRSAYEAADEADGVVVCTDWPEFRTVDLNELRRRLRRPVVVDGRNVFHPGPMLDAGFTYVSVGRRPVESRGTSDPG